MRCEDCWREAQLTAHNYESVTEAYFAAMKRAEERKAPCTQPSLDILPVEDDND